MPDKADVVIVGGGPAGLSTGAALARRGIAAQILERDTEIGASWASRYDALRLHTIRRFSGLAHYPIPSDRPRYLSKDDYAGYLQDYARACELDVALDTAVLSVRPREVCGTRQWEIVTPSQTLQARAVVMATGLYAEPRVPEALNSEAYAGTFLHASGYRNAAPFAGQRVVVVGLGNSGAEIAADLARHAVQSVCVAVRSSPPIVPREMMGVIPVQLFGIALAPLGLPRLLDRLGAGLRRISLGDLSRYGLRDADWGTFSTRRPALIDTGFLNQLRRGRVGIRPAVERLDRSGVRYAGGDREDADAVIAATGYGTGLEKILDESAFMPTLTEMRPAAGLASGPGLYCVGYTASVRGQLFEINRESRLIAAAVERYLGAVGFSGVSAPGNRRT